MELYFTYNWHVPFNSTFEIVLKWLHCTFSGMIIGSDTGNMQRPLCILVTIDCTSKIFYLLWNYFHKYSHH